MKILISGTAGFIGYHLANRLLADGHEVIGLDSVNDYYDPGLKYDRLSEAGINQEAVQYGVAVNSEKWPGYRFVQGKMEDAELMERVFRDNEPNAVCNLAAQAGVRYSLENPGAYIESNITGFANLLECCRHHNVGHLVFASSSSVYGLNKRMPFSTSDNVDHPVSLYAASKKSNELMAHTYSHLFGLPCTGLRFFTVYGPWGRPDMALFLFTKAMLEGRQIDIYNYGKMKRDFTYIDDIIEGMVRIIRRPPEPDPAWSGETPDPASSSAPYRIYNIGNSNPVELMDFIQTLEEKLGIVAKKNFMEIQPGDVTATWADVTALERAFGYRPGTSVQEGIGKFVDWYKAYYRIS